MSLFFRTICAVAFAAATLGSCQSHTTYDASEPGTPKVQTPAEEDDLSPRIDLPPDSVSTVAPTDTTMR